MGALAMAVGPITVDDGKYTFQTAADGYSVAVLRHGDPWLVIEQGCNAVHSLMYEVERLREEVATLRRSTP